MLPPIVEFNSYGKVIDVDRGRTYTLYVLLNTRNVVRNLQPVENRGVRIHTFIMNAKCRGRFKTKGFSVFSYYER